MTAPTLSPFGQHRELLAGTPTARELREAIRSVEAYRDEVARRRDHRQRTYDVALATPSPDDDPDPAAFNADQAADAHELERGTRLCDQLAAMLPDAERRDREAAVAADVGRFRVLSEEDAADVRRWPQAAAPALAALDRFAAREAEAQAIHRRLVAVGRADAISSIRWPGALQGESSISATAVLPSFDPNERRLWPAPTPTE